MFEHKLWSVIGSLQAMLETDITELNEGNHYNKTQAHKQQPPPPQRISESLVAILSKMSNFKQNNMIIQRRNTR